MHVVKINAPSGDLFYTGRSGDGFVSEDIAEAFVYKSEAEARIKAQRLNVSRTALRARFVVDRVERREPA